MNLIDRYVYAVSRRLPQKQREDIEKEVRSLIYDMLEEQGEEESQGSIEKVLLKLGDPEQLAESYQESKRYLIGPQNFNDYVMVLKLVAGAVFLGITIATMVGSAFTAGQSLAGIFGSYAATLFAALSQAFAWITLGFAWAEYRGVRLMDKKKEQKTWNLQELPVIPQKKAEISRLEPIVSILFTTVFISILCFVPQLIAAYINLGPGQTVVIPAFNLDVINKYNILFAAVMAIGIAKEVLKLMYGRWTLKLAVSQSLLSVASAVIMISVFANPSVWNGDFGVEVMKHLNVDIPFAVSQNKFAMGFLAVIVFATIVDVASAMVKGLRYNNFK